MNTKTFEALEFLNLPEDKIPSHTKQIQQVIENIFKSNDIKDIINLKPAINTLHSFRVRFPKMEPEVNAALFRLQAKSLSALNPAVKQGFAVSFLTSFEKQPASNIQDAQKLIHIMGDQDNLKNLMPMVQRRTLALANNFEKKFKETDKEMALARLLRDFVSYCYLLKSKKSVTDANWAHQITNTLAQIYPTKEFQTVADSFPQKASNPHCNTQKLPKEASLAYSYRVDRSHNHISQSYDR